MTSPFVQIRAIRGCIFCSQQTARTMLLRVVMCCRKKKKTTTGTTINNTGQQNTASPPLQSSRKLVEARDTVRGALRRLLSAISRYPHHYGSSRGSERIYFTTNYTNLHEWVPRGARNGKKETTTRTTKDNKVPRRARKEYILPRITRICTNRFLAGLGTERKKRQPEQLKQQRSDSPVL